MKRKAVSLLSTDELLKRFVELGVEQDDALPGPSRARFNRLYSEKTALLAELRNRSGDERRLLMKFYDHPNIQVRLNAAKATLAIAPAEARQELERIRASRYPPQAGDAGMAIWALDEGIFKPE